VFSVVSAALLVIFIILTGVTIAKHSGNLDSKRYREKYGTLTEGLWTENKIGRYWTVITLLRWATLCGILVSLDDYPSLQIIALLLQSFII
jgi:hypothetical protein